MKDNKSGRADDGDLMLERALDLWLDKNNKARQLTGADKMLPDTKCKVFRIRDYLLIEGRLYKNRFEIYPKINPDDA